MPNSSKPEPSKADSTLVAFDVGQRKLGIAVGQRLTGTATPLRVLPCNAGQPDWLVVEGVLTEWQPSALIVGVPLTESGQEQATTHLARRFANRLRGRFKLTVHEADERYTSQLAAERFATLRATGAVRRSQGQFDDAVAAQLILEHWMTDHHASPCTPGTIGKPQL